LAIAAGASGQARVDTGNALDASNRVGSGGFNQRSANIPQNILNNAVVTGNITGGREFRGNLGYGPSRAFRGTLAGSGTDRFVATSAGVTAGNFLSNAQTVRPFIGQSEGINPPAGFAQLGSSGGFVPKPVETRIDSDLRLGSVYESTAASPRYGFVLPGQIDTTGGNQSVISASPLYGIRPLNTGSEADVKFLQQYTDVFGTDTRSRNFNEAQLQRMRDELTEVEKNATAVPGQLDDAANNAPLNDQADSRVASDPMKSDSTTGQQVTNKVVLSRQQQQSEQFRAMTARLEKFNEFSKTDQTTKAMREYNEQARLKQELETPTTPPGTTPGGQTTPGGTPGAAPGSTPGTTPGGTAPGLTVPGTDAGAGTLLTGPTRNRKVELPKIDSLATGIKAKSLSDLMAEAEDLMGKGKFQSSLDKWDMAQRVAPDQPEVLLGRATAELGAASYANAETHLRQAFTGAPALMMARYDLRKFLGDERLTFLVKDLREIASNERTSARPLVLLAFIAFNEGSDRMAAGYLDLAEKRIGQKDAFFDSVRKHWELPAYDPNASDLNK
jgi:hypothetical protein